MTNKSPPAVPVLLNERPVAVDETITLCPGAVLRLGELDFMVERNVVGHA